MEVVVLKSNVRYLKERLESDRREISDLNFSITEVMSAYQIDDGEIKSEKELDLIEKCENMIM